MKNLVNAFDNLPWLVKLLFCLPGLNILWAIYRICKGATTKNTLMLVVGILWVVFGTVVLWLVDLISVIVWKKPTVLA
ncbi:MAG: hypothetical protein IKD36_03255 [Clostridia bacterium]|nr:hypothetical protein [Clostridia bacterium]